MYTHHIMKELLFWYLKFHFSGILSFSLKWTLHLCSLHCFQKEDIDFSNFLQMSEGCKSSQCPVLKLPSFPPPTSSHTSFIFLPQPVILLHLSASVCYPLVSKPSESGLSKTSTMYLVSDVLVQSLVTSILQCLLSTTYVFFLAGGQLQVSNRPVLQVSMRRNPNRHRENTPTPQTNDVIVPWHSPVPAPIKLRS